MILISHNYNYEVLVYCYIYNPNGITYCFYNNEFYSTSLDYNGFRASSGDGLGTFLIIISKTNKNITQRIELANCQINFAQLVAYRRIGINS